MMPLVDTIAELGREMGSYYGTITSSLVLGSYMPFAHVAQIRRTKVACHHDDRVPEVKFARCPSRSRP